MKPLTRTELVPLGIGRSFDLSFDLYCAPQDMHTGVRSATATATATIYGARGAVLDQGPVERTELYADEDNRRVFAITVRRARCTHTYRWRVLHDDWVASLYRAPQTEQGGPGVVVA